MYDTGRPYSRTVGLEGEAERFSGNYTRPPLLEDEDSPARNRFTVGETREINNNTIIILYCVEFYAVSEATTRGGRVLRVGGGRGRGALRGR